MYNSTLRVLTTVYDSWTQSHFVDTVNHLNQKRGLGSRFCFHLQAKKHLTCWTPEIELYSATGYFRNTQLLKTCI